MKRFKCNGTVLYGNLLKGPLPNGLAHQQGNCDAFGGWAASFLQEQSSASGQLVTCRLMRRRRRRWRRR